jgi:hypothetical protein
MWVRVQETGLRGGESLWAVCVSFDGETGLSEDTAEMLLHRMLVSGRPWSDFSAPDREVSERLFNRCEEQIVDRLNERRKDATTRNVAMVEARIASLTASFQAKRVSKERILQAHQQRGIQSMIRMVEGQMRKLESDYNAQVAALKERMEVSISYSVEGAGYVHVVHGDSSPD